MVTNGLCQSSGRKSASDEQWGENIGNAEEEGQLVGPTSKKPKPARKRKRTVKGAEPEVRRAIPLDYVTTDDVNLRAMPDMAAAKINGGLLGKGTRVKIAPQDWWYVEVEHPMTASGVLRGWISNSVLRRATDDDKGPTDAAVRSARAANAAARCCRPCRAAKKNG